MKDKLTHKGVLIGCDSRTRSGYTCRTFLRETKNFWVTQHGNKYRKGTGHGMGDWPLYQLDIDSIERLKVERGRDRTIK